MPVPKFEPGQRGHDPHGNAVYVVRASEVKGVIGVVYRYWVVDEEGGRPGTGFARLLEIGKFVADDVPPKRTAKPELLDQSMISEFQRFGPAKQKRRRAA